MILLVNKIVMGSINWQYGLTFQRQNKMKKCKVDIKRWHQAQWTGISGDPLSELKQKSSNPNNQAN